MMQRVATRNTDGEEEKSDVLPLARPPLGFVGVLGEEKS